MTFAVVLCYASARFAAQYAQIQPEPFVRLLLFALLLLSCRYKMSHAPLRRSETACFSIFSIAFAGSLVLGCHIVIENGRGYQNLMSQSYITPYAAYDVVALLFLTATAYLLATTLFSFAKSGTACRKSSEPAKAGELEKIGVKRVVVLAIAIFAFWIPYLLAYWPGFLFADSFSSICQAMGQEEWSNHHPVVYTLLVKLCLEIGTVLNVGAAGGCAVYSVLQMVLLAACFSYLSNWIPRRLGAPPQWAVAIAAALCLTPHIATYSIAMWKDPIFSAALVVATSLVADLIMSRGNVVTKRYWIPSFLLSLLVLVFFRNNGVFVASTLLLALLVAFVVSNDKEMRLGFKAAAKVAAVAVSLSLIILGPAYSVLGIKSDSKVEGAGIMLNQMARVTACAGDMSESDCEFMDEMLPLELYAEAYHPCSVDSLKWHEDFDGSVLDNGFTSHWASMLFKNPRTYFEAWELQTCGFWAVNVPEVNEGAVNIAAGVPVNTTGHLEREYGELGISTRNLFNDEMFRDVFPQDEPSVPVGVLNWAVLFLALCAALLGQPGWLVALCPSLGLAATLVVASPIWHAPRYAAAEQFLIPFYLTVFLILLFGDHASAPRTRQKESS